MGNIEAKNLPSSRTLTMNFRTYISRKRFGMASTGNRSALIIYFLMKA